MTKNILLAATAASVMAFAGAASAHTLTFRTIGAGGAIDTTETGVAATLPYALAAEAIPAAPSFATFALADALSGGNLPSGNVILTVTLSGGTFGSAVGAGAITAGPGCTTFTSTLSSGGASGGTSATFILSNSAPDCPAFNLDIPVTPNTGSAVTVTTTLATELNTPIDGLTASRQIISRPSAFAGVIDGAIGAGALADTFATLTVLPVYTTFSTTGGHSGGAPESATVGQLGTARITVDTAVHRDLADNLVAAGDVTAASFTVTGNFSAFNGAGGSATLGAAPMTINGAATSATVSGVQAALTGGTQAFVVTRETGGVIPSSTYSGSISYTLNATNYNQEGPFTGALETIQRDGTNVIMPWMNSTSIQSVSGSTNIVRLGNTNSVASGPVFAQVLNSTNPGTGYVPAAAPVQLFADIPANGERLITTAILTAAVGEFGRGDVQISVEAPSNTITARRFATLSNGDVTELTPGTVASDQNNVNVP